MEREDRYIVIKRKDAEAYLSDGLKADLDRVCDAISERREADGRHPMECVVVECDWPEYERVWDMIKARVDGEAKFPVVK